MLCFPKNLSRIAVLATLCCGLITAHVTSSSVTAQSFPVANNSYLLTDAIPTMPAAVAMQEPSPTVTEAPAIADCQSCKQLFGTDDNAIIQLGGWASFGYHDGPGNGLFNNHPNRFNPHQVWFFAEKVAQREPCQWDWGFRIDAMYGVDGADTQAFSNPPGSWDFQNGFDHGQFSWAAPQAYLEIGLNKTSIKIGHFYTLIGYEVVTAPDNFFYSHAITMYNSEPFTHTGVLVEREVNENITAYTGYTLGWDTGFNQLNSGSSFLGGFSVALSDDMTVTYISTAGNFGVRSAGRQGHSHSFVVDMQLTEKLNYVIQSDLLRVNGTGEDNVGLNQYLIYDVCDCFALGARVEWWKGDGVTGYAPFGSVVGAGSHSYYETTVGANVKLTDKVMVRPELRYDWSPSLGYEESTFGIDVIVTPF